jgi:2-desacetyl-2-hydroxyethyl bacteriochlorophyllide A dehydrogenase
MTPLVGAWTEPLAVAVRASGQGQLALGASLAVLGTGPIGQLVLQTARAAGAGEVLVVETSSHRRSVAKRCGASAVIGPDDVSSVDRLFDVVFDCTGAPAAFGTALDLVGHGGRIVLGSYRAPLTFAATAASMKESSIVFSAVYRDQHEFRTALQFLQRGLIDVEPLTTTVVPLREHEQAFAALRNPEQAVKILLDPRAA